MARKLVILIPPSEGKAPGGDGPPWQTGTMAVGELDPIRLQVLGALGADHPARLEPTLPASARYTGVLYKELDAVSLPAAERRRLARSLLTVSGLWGLVAPGDPIPPYKLKMSANVAPLGKLSTFWRPHLTASLAPRVKGAEVWDLLPQEHAAAVDWSELAPSRRITVQFLDASGKTVSHWNKLLKGSLVRWLAGVGAVGPEALADFDHPQGYRYDPAGSVVTARRAEVVLCEQ